MVTGTTTEAQGGIAEKVIIAPPSDPKALNEKSILINLTLQRPTLTKRISKDNTGDAVKSDANIDRLGVIAKLLTSKVYDEISKLDGQARHYVRSMSVPSFQLPANAYRVPLTLVNEVDAELEKMTAARDILVKQFLEDYPNEVLDGQEQLDTVAGLVTYQTKQQMGAKFHMGWMFTALTTPEKLAEFAPSVLKKEIAKAGATLNKEIDLIRDALRSGFAELVTHASERLTVKEDGKKTVFKDTFVSNMKEFMRTFDAKNLTDDGELSALVKQASEIIADLPEDPQALRDDEELRKKVKAAFDEVNVAVGDLQNVTGVKSRKVRLPRKRTTPKTPKVEAAAPGGEQGELTAEQAEATVKVETVSSNDTVEVEATEPDAPDESKGELTAEQAEAALEAEGQAQEQAQAEAAIEIEVASSNDTVAVGAEAEAIKAKTPKLLSDE